VPGASTVKGLVVLNANEVVSHRKKQALRVRLNGALRSLARLQHVARIAQVYYDLACKVDLTGPIDQSKLPATPDGFVVKQSAILKCGNLATETLCLYQVVSMMVLYYWLYAAMNDAQDARSCERYLEWVEAYANAPKAYKVVGNVRYGYYLYPLKGTPENKPHLPEWLGEETV